MEAERQAYNYVELIRAIMNLGNEVSPRDMMIKELEDAQLEVDPIHPFMTLRARKYDVNYFRQEMKWKLGANKYDESIKSYAKTWTDVQNPDKTYNSNYGQYWFGEQMGVWNVVTELVRDPSSRRAVIPMLRAEHMAPHVKDTVCTEAVGFRVRYGALNMSVHMRSSDAIFGLGTDLPTFAFLYRLVKGLIEPCLGELEVGLITVTAMSCHIYDRHYEMAAQIIKDGPTTYKTEYMPLCKANEATYIIASRGKLDPSNQNYGDLCRWLKLSS
jgi:thymidylate synthase